MSKKMKLTVKGKSRQREKIKTYLLAIWIVNPISRYLCVMKKKGKTRLRPFGFVSPIKLAPMCGEKGIRPDFGHLDFVSPIK